MPPNILSDYLAEIARIRATRAGTGEVSYYGALAGALNAAGERLKPRVFCVPNLRNRGVGFPDMGLFVVARGHAPEEWPEAAAPERGVVEVDDIPAELSVKLRSAQVDALSRRLRSRAGHELPRVRAAGPRRERASRSGGKLQLRLRRCRCVLRPGARHATPCRAGRALRRVPGARAAASGTARAAGGRRVLSRLLRPRRAGAGRGAREPACFRGPAERLAGRAGPAFEGPKGEHLFRSTLVQTLFYGLFSAWVEVARDGQANFDWHAAGWSLHVPFVDALFQRIATPQYLKPLGLEEPLSWAAAALNRVDRDGVLRALRGSGCRPLFLRAVPGGVRPCAAQAAWRLVHAARDRPLHGRARRSGAAQRTRHRGRAGRSVGVDSRSVLRHRRLSGGSAGPHRPHPARQGRGRADRGAI